MRLAAGISLALIAGFVGFIYLAAATRRYREGRRVAKWARDIRWSTKGRGW